MCVCVCVCVCAAKPVAVELRCHATALIFVIGKTQFRRAMLSCDTLVTFNSRMLDLRIEDGTVFPIANSNFYFGWLQPFAN